MAQDVEQHIQLPPVRVAQNGASPLRVRKFGREIGGIAYMLKQFATTFAQGNVQHIERGAQQDWGNRLFAESPPFQGEEEGAEVERAGLMPDDQFADLFVSQPAIG